MKTEMKTKTTQGTLTLEALKNEVQEDLHAAIEFAKKFYPTYLPPPVRPFLKKDANSSEVRQYAADLERFENAREVWKEEALKYEESRKYITSIIEQYIKDLAGLDRVPQDKRGKVWDKAYSDGHSDGYVSVYNHLVELIGLFL